jgi:hypothetical protein
MNKETNNIFDQYKKLILEKAITQPSEVKVTQQPGATRNMPLSNALVETIKRGLQGTGLSWHSYSGGQPAKGSGGKRVGSTRHDNGRASDGYFIDTATGRTLDGTNAADQKRLAEALRKLRQAGIQGIGWGVGYMGPKNFHLDIVTPAVWGAGGKSANAAPWVVNAVAGITSTPPSDSGQPSETGTENMPPSVSDDPTVNQAAGGLQQFINSAVSDFSTAGLKKALGGTLGAAFAAIKDPSGFLPKTK